MFAGLSHPPKKFSQLTEREILAVAISAEEEDARIYMTFAEDLEELKVAEFPARVWASRASMVGSMLAACGR